MGAFKTTAGIASVLVVIGSVGWLAMQWSGWQQAKAELAQERARMGNARALQQAEIKRADVAEKRLAALQQEKAAAARRAPGAGMPAVSGGAPTSENGWDPEKEGNDLMARNPALKEAVLARSDAQARFRFAAALAEAGASPEQIEAFIRLRREGTVIGAPFGPNRAMLAFHAGEGLDEAERARRTREILGEAIYARKDEILRRGETRALTHDLAAALTFSDAPLTAEQAREVEALLRRSSVPKAGIDWNAVTVAAGGLLGSEQLAALERIRAEELESRRLNQKPHELITQKKGPTL